MNSIKRDLISIIIVNWNGKKWIDACLNSLKSQTYKNIEILFVDNNSSDHSVEYLKEHYNNVHIVESKINLGFAGGNSLGIDTAKGEYILLLNSDTWIESNFINELFSFYSKGSYDIVGPMENDYNNCRFQKNISTIDLLGHTVALKLSKATENKLFYKSGACLFFKKDLYKETGGLDSDFFMYVEEVDWFWRLHLLKKKVGSVENLYVHHAGSGSTGGGIKYNTFLWRNQNTLQMLLKNYSFCSLLWVLPLYLIQNLFEIVFFLLALKPDIALSYISSWIYNARLLKKTLNKRRKIQSLRLVSDFVIINKMYFGLGKLKHLFAFYKK